MKKTIAIICIVFLFGCDEVRVMDVIKSGEMKHIQYSNYNILGTDSSFIIIDRATGKTVNIINRKH